MGKAKHACVICAVAFATVQRLCWRGIISLILVVILSIEKKKDEDLDGDLGEELGIGGKRERNGLSDEQLDMDLRMESF